jgi:predicted metal-dependent hydrolase
MKFFRISDLIGVRRPIVLRRSVYHTRSQKLYLANKEAARVLVHNRVSHFLNYYHTHHNISVGKIAIRNQRSRWGSCSKKGNLNFNYKLVFLTPIQQDYIIVHEICHLKEFNHGQGFWDLVAETIPEWKKIRAELKRVGRVD